MTIICHQKDLDTQKVVGKYLNCIENIRIIVYSGNKIHNKGYIIKYGLDKINARDYIILSDADMIFHKDTLSRTNIALISNTRCVLSSTREDISKFDVDLFMNNYMNEEYLWPWEHLKREVISSSPFMGWFLVFTHEVIEKLDFSIKHQGYDVFDWKLFGQLTKEGLQKRLIKFDFAPLHIYHGEKGKNWQGVDLKNSVL
jgi:cellulose synthase/poly-beta-1,6-N-acetylglucosamine synthase-like glycosyltransferase